MPQTYTPGHPTPSPGGQQLTRLCGCWVERPLKEGRKEGRWGWGWPTTSRTPLLPNPTLPDQSECSGGWSQPCSHPQGNGASRLPSLSWAWADCRSTSCCLSGVPVWGLPRRGAGQVLTGELLNWGWQVLMGPHQAHGADPRPQFGAETGHGHLQARDEWAQAEDGCTTENKGA